MATVLRGIASEDQPGPAMKSQAAPGELIELEIPSIEKVSDESPTESKVMISGASAPSPPRSRSASRRGGHPVVRKEALSAEEPVEPVDLAGSATEAAAAAPSLSLDQLGLEGPNRLSLRLPEAEHRPATERAASAERVVQSMRQSAQEHDRKLGLGAGGPVAMALENAAYRSHVKLDGQATFEVVVIGNAVSAISLVPSSGDKQSAWNEVAQTALAQLAGRRVRVPTGSRGVVLRIQLVSRAALPSGHDPGVEVTVGPFVVQRGRGKKSARLAFLDSVRLTSASDLLGTSVPFSAPGAVVSLVRTDIDPVDWGANDRQVVHSYTLDETLLD